MATNSFGSSTAQSGATPIVVAAFQILALRFRPALLFHRGLTINRTNERWRPLDIPSFLGEANSSSFDHIICNDHEGGTCAPLSSAADFAAHSLDSAYIDVVEGVSNDRPSESHCPGFAPVDNDQEGRIEDCNFGATSVVYYEPGQDKASYRYLDYWWFMRQNDVAAVPNAFGFDNHVGDWEGVTVVLDPFSNATNPVVSHVLYAAHNMSVWVTGNAVPKEPGTPERPEVWVAHGTHASYQFPCTEEEACSQPTGASFPNEAPHDGLAGWGNNDDAVCNSDCVRRFPSSGWPYWPGRWGRTEGVPGDFFGWSPQSPGMQGRFLCAQNGRSDGICSRPPGSRSPLWRKTPPVGRPANARACKGWFGFGIATLACDPVELRKAVREHSLTRDWTLHLRNEGRRAGDSPGIAANRSRRGRR